MNTLICLLNLWVWICFLLTNAVSTTMFFCGVFVRIYLYVCLILLLLFTVDLCCIDALFQLLDHTSCHIHILCLCKLLAEFCEWNGTIERDIFVPMYCLNPYHMAILEKSTAFTLPFFNSLLNRQRIIVCSVSKDFQKIGL